MSGWIKRRWLRVGTGVVTAWLIGGLILGLIEGLIGGLILGLIFGLGALIAAGFLYHAA